MERQKAEQSAKENKGAVVLQAAFRGHKGRQESGQLRVEKQESDLVSNFLGFLGGNPMPLKDKSREARLASWATGSYNVFNQTTPDYAFVKTQANADQYDGLFDLAVSFRSKQDDSHADNSWILKAREMGPGDLPAAVKLVRRCHEVLMKAAAEMSEDVLVTGGHIGIDLQSQATEDEMRVMIPALRHSGANAFLAKGGNADNTLAELSRIYLDAAFKYESANSPNRKAVYNEKLFNQHKAHCFIAAATFKGSTITDAAIAAELAKKGIEMKELEIGQIRENYDRLVK